MEKMGGLVVGYLFRDDSGLKTSGTLITVRGKAAARRGEPSKRGTGESFSVPLAQHSQEPCQRESAGLAATEGSCVDF